MTGSRSGASAGSQAGLVADGGWTSDAELDRLRVLMDTLHDWAEVYQRWRHHELSGAHPAQDPFGPDDRAAVDALRGFDFGALTAAARHWRELAVTATRWAESCQASRDALGASWRDDGGRAADPALTRIQRLVADCGARCERLGLHLELAFGDSAAPAIAETVRQILARSRAFAAPETLESPRIWGARITELDRTLHESGSLTGEHHCWRAALDALVVDYDAVLGLFRADLDAARRALDAICRTVHDGMGGPGDPASGGAIPDAPAATRPASAQSPDQTPDSDQTSASDQTPASAHSNASAGGGGALGTGDDPVGQGEPGDQERPAPAAGTGGARLASVAADPGEPGCGPAAASGSSLAGTAGATAGPGSDDRTGKPRPGRR